MRTLFAGVELVLILTLVLTVLVTLPLWGPFVIAWEIHEGRKFVANKRRTGGYWDHP